MEVKKHYKLYKAGKQWIIGAVTVLGLFGAMGIASAHADTVTNQTDTTMAQTTSSANSAGSSTATSSAESQSSSAASVSSKATNPQSFEATSLSSSETATSSAASSLSTKQNSLVSSSATTSSAATTKAVNSSNVTNIATPSQAVSSNEEVTASAASNAPSPASSSNNIVKSGVFGTSAWDIDSQGALNIHAGVLGSSTDAGKWDGLTSNNINTINIDQGVVANADSSGLFRDNNAYGTNSILKKINGLGNLDTSNVTDMSYMFSGLNSLTELDLTKFNTSKVTNMQYMFAGAPGPTSLIGNSQIKDIDVSSFDTSKVTTMEGMFSDLTSLLSLDLSNFNTKSVTNMLGMFTVDTNLKTLNVANFDTSNVTNMFMMFFDNFNLENLDVTNWNVSSLVNAEMLFAGDLKLPNINITNWVAPHLGSITGMFTLTGITSLDLSNFNMRTVIANNSSTSLLDIFYDNVGNIQTVTLGPNTLLPDLSNIASNETYGKMILAPDGSYTKYAYGSNGILGVQDIGTGTANNPNGPMYTWQELSALYQDGGPVKTFVLAKHLIPDTVMSDTFTANDGSINSNSQLTLDNGTILNGNTEQNTGILAIDKLQIPIPPKYLNNGAYIFDSNLENSNIIIYDNDGNVESSYTIQQAVSDLNLQSDSYSYTQLLSLIQNLNNSFANTTNFSTTNLGVKLNLNYIHQVAAPVNVNYVDDQGKVLTTGTANYPNGQFINESYTTTPKSIDGYTFKQLSSDSLAAIGVLNSTGGTVTYVYTQDVSQPITLNVIDTDTGQVLNSTDFIGGLNDSLAVQDSDYIPTQYHLATGDELNGQTQLQDGNYAWTTAPQTLNIYVSGDKSTVTQTRNVTRTVKFITPSNTLSIGDMIETVQLSRDVTTDLATGTIIKTTDWAAVGSDIWPGITIPTIAGYHATITVLPDQTVTGTTTNSVVQVKYVAN